jgi:hypothetical protein
MNQIPCNCGHSREDHKDLGSHKQSFPTWCIYSETGNCACDYFTVMTNIEYLDWKYATRYPNKK